MKKYRILRWLFITTAVVLCGCRHRPYPIFFLLESDDAQGVTSRFAYTYMGHTYTRTPIVNHSDMESFHSNLDPHTGSYGVTFTVKKPLYNRLYTETINRQGKLILPVVNGLAFQPLLINRPITDGKLVVWSGLNGYDLKRIAEDIKPENPEMEKKRFQKNNPRKKMIIHPSTFRRRDHMGRPIGELTPNAS